MFRRAFFCVLCAAVIYAVSTMWLTPAVPSVTAPIGEEPTEMHEAMDVASDSAESNGN